MFFIKQNTLTDAEFYEIGRNYDIESNIDMYKDKVPKLKKFRFWFCTPVLHTYCLTFTIFSFRFS